MQKAMIENSLLFSSKLVLHTHLNHLENFSCEEQEFESHNAHHHAKHGATQTCAKPTILLRKQN